MDFCTVPAGTYELGSRFSLADEPWKSIPKDDETKSLLAFQTERSSPRRTVELPAIAIAKEPIRLSEIVGSPYALEAGVTTIASLAKLVDTRLAERGLRVPTEDELEAACGGTLFSWGDEIPAGVPYGDETAFTKHKGPNAFGLVLLGDPYKVELTREAFKLGDGGGSLCGGDPWPVPWIALSPAFRLVDADVEDCFPETLEECFVRPVKIA